MITDDELTELLRDVRDSADGLDSAQVLAGAGRRRTRVRLTAATGAACVAVAAVALTATTFTGGSTEAGVAGGPDGTRPSSAPVPAQRTAPVQRAEPGPYVGKLGALPLGTIPVKGKVEIAPKYWFETRGTRWCITTTDGAPEPYEPFGCRGTVGNSNIGDGTSPGIQRSSIGRDRVLVSSVFKGDARRVVYTEGKHAYEAKVYRLAGVPGWVMSSAIYRPTGPETTATPRSSGVRPDRDLGVFAYDASGKLIASFPRMRGAHPLETTGVIPAR